MYLPLPLLIAVLYPTHPVVTKVTHSVKYKHVLNRWHGKKSLGTRNILAFRGKALFVNGVLEFVKVAGM